MNDIDRDAADLVGWPVPLERKAEENKGAAVALPEWEWHTKFNALLEDYVGACMETAVWNVTQSVQPKDGVRMARPRREALLTHVTDLRARLAAAEAEVVRLRARRDEAVAALGRMVEAYFAARTTLANLKEQAA